ncbi:MAG: M56 family metallopeptidase [bacterium]
MVDTLTGDFWFLWDCAWQSTAFLIVGGALGFVWRRQPARAHRVLLFAVVAALATPLMSLTVRHFGLGVLTKPIVPAKSRPWTEPRGLNGSRSAVPQDMSASVVSPGSKSDSLPSTKGIGTEFGSPYSRFMSARIIVPSLWGMLSILVLIRLLFSLVRGARLVSRARRVDDGRIRRAAEAAALKLELDVTPNIRESDDILCPLVWGWGRQPVLLFPSSSAEDEGTIEWEGILCHELGHWKRRDHFGALIAELLICAFPWQPLGWLAKRRLSHLSEQACDVWVLACGEHAFSYARSLLGLVPQESTAFTLSAMSHSKSLENRISSILRSKQVNPSLGRLWSCGASITAICIVAVIALAQAAEGLYPLHGPNGEIILGLGTLNTVAFHPDGKYILTGGTAGAFLRDISTGEVIRAFLATEPAEQMFSAKFSIDGKYLVTVRKTHWVDGTATVWDVASGEKLHTFDWACDAVFMPDGAQVVTVGHYGKLHLWDLETGEELRSMEIQKGYYWVGSLAVSLNRSQVLITNETAGTIVWNSATGGVLRVFENAGGACVAISPDGMQFVTGREDGIATLWDTATGEEIRTFEGHTYAIASVAFSPDGEQIITDNSVDEAARLWDVATGEQVNSYQSSGTSAWYGDPVAFSPDGTRLLTVADEKTAILWEVESGDEIQSYGGHLGPVQSVAISPDQTVIATAPRLFDEPGGALLWDAASGHQLKTLSPRSTIECVAFSPDGTRVATGEYWKATVWDIGTGRVFRNFTSEVHLTSVAFSPDGTQLLIGQGDAYSGEGSAKLYDLADRGRLKKTFREAGGVHSVDFSSGGEKLLIGRGDGKVRLLDVETGEELLTVTSHPSAIQSVSFSPEGTRFLTACIEGPADAKLWDALTGELLQTFQLKENNVNYNDIICVEFSPDGKRLLTATDIAVKLWDASTGEELRTLPHVGAVWSATFFPDGTKVLTGCTDGTARIWDISDLADRTGIRDFGRY